MMPLLDARALIHRRYVRAVASAASLALILLSLGALELRLRHQVSMGAVVRYFTRDHHREADLTSLLRNRASSVQIARLASPITGDSLGGFVYANDRHLIFYPHLALGTRGHQEQEIENRAVYARLVPLYHEADVDRLLQELSASEVRTGLRTRGVDPEGVGELKRRLAAGRSDEDRIRVLRLAGRFLQAFTPHERTQYGHDLREKLRFYEDRSPSGSFVGQFVVLDAFWDRLIDEQSLRELSRHSHFILLRRVGATILVSDHYQGQERHYSIRPFGHRSGSTLYRLATLG